MNDLFLEKILRSHTGESEIGSSKIKMTPELKKLEELYKQGWPVDYLLKNPIINGLKITLIPKKVFIPRPETIEWVNDLAIPLIKKIKPEKVLDICSGSGHIGIKVNKETNSLIDFVELSSVAAEITKFNAIENGLNEDSFDVFNIDAKEYLDKCDLTNVILLCNPPYVPDSLNNNEYKEENNIQYEPEMAIFSGEDGLDLFKSFIDSLSNRSDIPLAMIFELDNSAFKKAQEYTTRLIGERYKNIRIIKDNLHFDSSEQKDRVLLISN